MVHTIISYVVNMIGARGPIFDDYLWQSKTRTCSDTSCLPQTQRPVQQCIRPIGLECEVSGQRNTSGAVVSIRCRKKAAEPKHQIICSCLCIL